MEEKFDYHVPQTATTSSASLQTLQVAKFVTLFGKENLIMSPRTTVKLMKEGLDLLVITTTMNVP